MTFVDVPFPECISFGAQSDPMWQTGLTTVLSGYEATNQDWSQARHSYDVGLAVRTVSDYLLVRAHFHQMRGRAKSFPFTDFLDHTVSQSAGVLTAAGDDWQMYYRYGSGADAYDRKITRPKSGTVTVYRTRSAVTTDATADATISYTTGIVEIANHVGGDTYAWAGDFYVPCRYAQDRLPSAAINKQPGENGELYVDCPSITLLEVRE